MDVPSPMIAAAPGNQVFEWVTPYTWQKPPPRYIRPSRRDNPGAPTVQFTPQPPPPRPAQIQFAPQFWSEIIEMRRNELFVLGITRMSSGRAFNCREHMARLIIMTQMRLGIQLYGTLGTLRHPVENGPRWQPRSFNSNHFYQRKARRSDHLGNWP